MGKFFTTLSIFSAIAETRYRFLSNFSSRIAEKMSLDKGRHLFGT